MAAEAIRTAGAPAALGPYSQGIKAGGWLFTSGQIPLTSDGRMVVEIGAATRQALENVRAVLAAGGASMKDVVRVTVYLRDMADFAAVNEIYATFFEVPPPARSCVEVARLPKDAAVEIEAVAWLG